MLETEKPGGGRIDVCGGGEDGCARLLLRFVDDNMARMTRSTPMRESKR